MKISEMYVKHTMASTQTGLKFIITLQQTPKQTESSKLFFIALSPLHE